MKNYFVAGAAAVGGIAGYMTYTIYQMWITRPVFQAIQIPLILTAAVAVSSLAILKLGLRDEKLEREVRLELERELEELGERESEETREEREPELDVLAPLLEKGKTPNGLDPFKVAIEKAILSKLQAGDINFEVEFKGSKKIDIFGMEAEVRPTRPIPLTTRSGPGRPLGSTKKREKHEEKEEAEFSAEPEEFAPIEGR